MKRPLIFLTGCINPSNMAFTLLLDAEVRYKQYVDAIRFYLKETDLPILFVENSGVDISKEFIADPYRSRIEIITFQGNDFDKGLGKGYGEMTIIEHALKESLFFNNADFIFKITGRYKILNVNAFIDRYNKSQPSIQVLVDLRKSLSFSDARFFGAERSFFAQLIEYKRVINDSKSIFFEHVLAQLVHHKIAEHCNYSFLMYLPRFSGIYATDNIKYNDSWFYWFPRNIKHRLRYYLMNY